MGKILDKTASGVVQDWSRNDPALKEWFEKVARKNKNTATTYANYLWLYWNRHLKLSGYKSMTEWLNEVRIQQGSSDVQVKRAWGEDLEKWFLSTTLKAGSRFILACAVKSLLWHHMDFARFRFTLRSKEERDRDMEENENLTPPTTDEIRKLIAEANTTYKAVILTSLPGLGVGEFVYLSRNWFKYEKAIREKNVPVEVSVVRPKNGIKYWTLLFEDAVDALGDLISERERNLVRPLTKGDSLFTDKNGRALRESDIQREIRRLADRTGVDPKVPGKRIYRIRPHELGRDHFKTTCENNGVPNTISEFCMGHRVDKYEYNKFAATKEGKQRVRLALGKIRQHLNVVTGRGEVKEDEPYIVRVKKQADVLGMSPDEFVNAVVAHALRDTNFLRTMNKMEEQRGSGGYGNEWETREPITPEEVLAAMPEALVRPLVVSMVKARNQSSVPNAPDQVVDVDSGELDRYLKAGWKFVSIVNAHKAVVRWESGGTPPYPGNA